MSGMETTLSTMASAGELPITFPNESPSRTVGLRMFTGFFGRCDSSFSFIRTIF